MSIPPNDLILYHYGASPYARRIVWYLAFRHIAYASCNQPPYLPRPDLKDKLAVNYRRIPLLAHGNTLHLDSRHILSHLERVFPDTTGCPSLTPRTANGRAVLKLLERYTTDAGVFPRAASLIPASAPLLKDAKFQADRKEFSGREFSPDAFDRARPEALTVLRDLFELLEHTILSDGRIWVATSAQEEGLGGAGGQGPDLADIEAVWILDWLLSMPGALPSSLFSSNTYPKTFAWHARFKTALAAAQSAAGKPGKISGDDAAKYILSAKSMSEPAHDATDPLGLQPGEDVVLYPTDSGSGSANRDQGKLLALSRDVVVIQKDKVRVCAPRWGFRVMKAGGAKL